MALILLVAIVGVGGVLYLHHRLTSDVQPVDPQLEPAAADSECCGLHIVCEKDSLLAGVSAEIEYYDDEELDRFAGRAATDYTEAEGEEFREVMLTMRPEEIAGWARSLQLRGIEIPADVREELIMIIAERRSQL